MSIENEKERGNSSLSGKIAISLLAVALLSTGCFIVMSGSNNSDADPLGDFKEGDFWYEIRDSNVAMSYYDGSATTVSIPAMVTHESVEYTVTAIGDRAFLGKGITSVTIPDTVTVIELSAFYECPSLESITIPDSVTEIGTTAFFNCSSLASVTIGDSVTTIGESAFQDCDALTSVTFGKSVATIGDKAFYRCGNLLSATLPDTVTRIGVNAFYECFELKSVNIPDSVTEIGSRAFEYCQSLTSVTIPDKVTVIEEGTFHQCDHLESVIIGDSVTAIRNEAFFYCPSVVDVTFGSSIESLGTNAFKFDDFYIDEEKVIGYSKLRNLSFESNGIDKFENHLKPIELDIKERTYAYDGNVHTVVEDSEDYTAENCSSKDAGTYHAKISVTPGYRIKVIDSEGTHEVSVCKFDWAITPKTVEISWGETTFEYDGKAHVPAATAKGLIDGDTCIVTVTGEQTEKGTYTATATALSNSNYVLPTDTTKLTCEFTIKASGSGDGPKDSKTVGLGIVLGIAAISVAALVLTFVVKPKH